MTGIKDDGRGKGKKKSGGGGVSNKGVGERLGGVREGK